MRTNPNIPTPQELAQLNSAYGAPASTLAQQTPQVTQSSMMPTPQELAELNRGYGLSQGSGLETELKNVGKSAVAGLGELGQTIAKDIATPGLGGFASGMNIINALPENIQRSMSGTAQQISNYNIPQSMNIPQTGFNRFVQGAFKESPAIIAGIMSGGAADLPAAAGSIAAQGGIGAGLSPNHPLSGAITGAALQTAGEIAPAILGKTADGFIKGSMNRLMPYAKNLYNEAQKGYNVLDQMGKTKLVDQVSPPLSDAFGKIYNPQEAANYLQSVKDQNPSNIDVMKPAINALKPSYSPAILSKFDPNTLNSFNSLPKGNAYNQFQSFLKDPSAQNAGIFHRALGAARTGNNYDIDQIYSDMRDQLKDNIIMPGIQKFGSPADFENYGNANLNYAQYKKLFGNDAEMENFARGDISPADMNSNRYYNMLKRSKESGAFNSAQGQPTTLPMMEYNALQQKMLNPGLIQRAINSVAKPAAYITKKAPLAKMGILGYQGMNNQ